MNIEKLKTYNQKLLAVLGTVAVGIAVISLISIAYFTITEITRNSGNNYQDEGIFSDETTEELLEENKRQQFISYDIPQLVDTLKLIYIIPVSHKTLKNPEDINNELIGLMSSKESSYNKRYSQQYYGNFNNLLIYDNKKDSIIKLFFNKVNFSYIQTEYFEDDILIMMKASDNDTYKDGVINLEDYKSLYIFSLNENKFKKISLRNADIIQYNFIPGSKDLLIQFGMDKDKNGKFDQYKEASIIMKYNFQTDELTNIVSDIINKELQNTLEGTK